MAPTPPTPACDPSVGSGSVGGDVVGTVLRSPRYVFVAGLHRSGTTVVARMLAEVPGVAGLRGTGVPEDEGHHLHDAVPSAIELGGPGRFAFDPRSHLGPCADPSRYRPVMEQAWRPFWSDEAATIRVEKSPQNLLQTRFLASVFEGASFVVVLRHPAAVALATRKWTRPGPRGLRRVMPRASVRSLLAHWIRAHDLMERDRYLLAQEFPQSRMIVVRYEDLLGNPEEVAGRFRDELDLPACPPVEGIDPRRGRYQAEWTRWRTSAVGRRAARTWLPMAEVAAQRWQYSLDEPLC